MKFSLAMSMFSTKLSLAKDIQFWIPKMELHANVD